MKFICISISLKTSNILENKSQVFERSDSIITIHNDLFSPTLEKTVCIVQVGMRLCKKNFLKILQ